MSLTSHPCSKWDVERFIYTDPALSTTERWVAVQILKSLDNKFRPVTGALMSQALIGYRLHKWRETVNRAVRKLVILGYFRTSWVSVNRSTVQGIKGVTRVMCELGPVLRRLVETGRTDGSVSAGQPRGVSSPHPSPTPPGRPMTAGDAVLAKSADRMSGSRENDADFKRKTLDRWPRLAGKPQATPAPPRFEDLAERQRAAIARGEELGLGADELSADEYAARWHDRARRGADQLRARLTGRVQPRRLPRSRR